MSESAIANYLAQLDRELRVKRAPRRRLLAEAADHLRASAEEIAATGVEARAAEEEAVGRFGAAAVVARRFAHAVATRSARMALVWAASACASYAVAAGFFVLRGPSWLRDFPQGAPSMLALQVALVALLLTGIRAFRFRGALLIDELRLRLLANGVAIASGALAIAAGAELVLALTRPAAAPWRDAADVIGVYAIAAATTLAASFVAVASVARASVFAALPRESGDELPPAIAALVDDVAVTAPPLRPAAVWLTSRPVVACTATAGGLRRDDCRRRSWRQRRRLGRCRGDRAGRGRGGGHRVSRAWARARSAGAAVGTALKGTSPSAAARRPHGDRPPRADEALSPRGRGRRRHCRHAPPFAHSACLPERSREDDPDQDAARQQRLARPELDLDALGIPLVVAALVVVGWAATLTSTRLASGRRSRPQATVFAAL